MSEVLAVILDVDGTLIDSNDAHAQAFVDAADELGIDGASFEEVRPLIGMGSDKLVPRVFGFEKSSPQGQRLVKRKGEIFRGRYLPELEPTPGTRELLERLRADGFRLVVATSATKKDLQGLLEQAGVQDLIEESTSAGEVESTKPDPDVVLAALKQAGFPPERVVMIGDTPYDVEAARRAGVRLIGVRTGGWSAEQLEGAIAVYDHPADLLDHYAETPLGR